MDTILENMDWAGNWFGHEPSIRVPLIMADFRAQPLGLRTSALALNIDVAPTILSVASLSAPARMQGSDLPQLLDPEQALRWRSEFLYEHLVDHPHIPKTEGLIGKRYRYMRYFRGADSFEQVFDLETDPDELKTWRMSLRRLWPNCANGRAV